MIKLINEDIDGLRWCIIQKTGRSYTFVIFCDSLPQAKIGAAAYSDSDFWFDGGNTEYWAFDTKKNGNLVFL